MKPRMMARLTTSRNMAALCRGCFRFVRTNKDILCILGSRGDETSDLRARRNNNDSSNDIDMRSKSMLGSSKTEGAGART